MGVWEVWACRRARSGLLGSTAPLLAAGQAITDTFDYWPYCEVKSRTGTTATAFQFVGTVGYYKDNSSRTYVRARTLRTDLARWLTEDLFGLGGGGGNFGGYLAFSIDRSGFQCPAGNASGSPVQFLRRCASRVGLRR